MLTAPQTKKVPSAIRTAKPGGVRLEVKGPRDAVGSGDSVEQPHIFGWTYLKECIAASPHGTLCVALALVIGFYHGSLKRAYPGALAVFAYDIPLLLGLVFAVKSVPAKNPLFPNSRTSIAIRLVLVLCVIYCLIPTNVPWLLRLASLRGWTFTPLMFLVGYHVLRSSRVLVAFSGLFLLLCISVTIIGAFQDPSDYVNLKIEDEGFRKTIYGTTYAKSGGGGGFRVFSTFVGPGMFAATLVFGVLIAVGQSTSDKAGLFERVFWAVGGLFSLYGIFISGSRSSMLVAILGSAFIVMMRQKLIKIVPWVAAVGVVAFLSSVSIKTIDFDRMIAGFSLVDVSSRLWIVVFPAFLNLLEYPLGQGIGHSTHGFPVMLFHLISRFTPSTIDGDVGQAAVDFGLVGMVIYMMMMVRAIQDSIRWTIALRGTDDEAAGIVASAFVVITLPSFFVGSPFLHIPTGAIICCYLGGLNRIYDDKIKTAEPPKGWRHQPLKIPGDGGGPHGRSVPPVLVESVRAVSGTGRSVKSDGSKRYLYGQ